MSEGPSPPPLPEEIIGYYAGGVEAARLSRGHGVLELARTQEIIARHLPARSLTVLDIGGGPGAYACWLAELGHTVHLVDAVALHVEQALAASARRPRPLASARVGDARRLDWPDGSADVALVLGPLYHLTERSDRLTALREAARALRPGGLLVAAAVSRFASLLDGLFTGYLADAEYASLVERDLREGQHRNPGRRDYFTTAFFHRPEELAAETADAGFESVEVVGVEGPGWLAPDLEARWKDPKRREEILLAARLVERDPALLAVSAHLLAVAHKPA